MSPITTTVAIGSQFMDALARLPQKTQKKTRDMITKFQQNPTSPGLNYEKIKSKDPRMRSLRIDQSYRAIVLQVEKSNTFLLLWVDNHDEAYSWAEGRVCSVNAITGGIQVVDVSEIQAVPTKIVEPTDQSSPEENKPDIFQQFSDTDLAGVGVTDLMLPLVRSIRSEPALESLDGTIPKAVYNALYMLALGESYDVVREDLAIVPNANYDTADIDSALKLDQNKNHFSSFTDDAELEALLNAPMDKWRVYLHPSQRKLVNAHFNGPARVLGGAGTGKTVVAMHRAKHLASQCKPNEKIFFTTFTKSLIQDIKNNLQKICSFDEIKKIEINHIDAWCHDFLNRQNMPCEVAYENHTLRKNIWQTALTYNEEEGLDEDFLKEEWNKVIQYHDFHTLAEYIRIPRAGRNQRLTRLQRKRIWPVFREYRRLLLENNIYEPADMFRVARGVLTSKKIVSGFKHIIADEVQDLHPQALRLLRAILPKDHFKQNDLFLVGDGHQNLYGHHIVLSQLGINIIGRGKRLKINYRTPEESRRWASSVLAGTSISDLDGELDSSKGYVSLISGPEPVFISAKSFEEEVEAIAEWIKKIKSEDPTKVVCVTARTKGEITALAESLPTKGITKLHIIDTNNHDCDDHDPIRLITHHRIKGLEFDHVCISGCSQQKWASNNRIRISAQKCLLHVAATRTKNSLLVTAIGPVLKQWNE